MGDAGTPTLNGGAGGGTWYNQAGNGSVITTFPALTVGDSFFIQGNGAAPVDTLTIAGAVSIQNGTNGTRAILGNSAYVMQGSQLPVAGGLYNLGFNPPDGTVVYPWNTGIGSFSGGGYAFYSGVNNGSSGGWYSNAGNGSVLTGTGVTFTNGGFIFADLPVLAGQGLFIQGGTVNGVGSTNWVESLNLQ